MYESLIAERATGTEIMILQGRQKFVFTLYFHTWVFQFFLVNQQLVG